MKMYIKTKNCFELKSFINKRFYSVYTDNYQKSNGKVEISHKVLYFYFERIPK